MTDSASRTFPKRSLVLIACAVYLALLAYATFGPPTRVGIENVAIGVKTVTDDSFEGDGRKAIRELGRSRVEGVANLVLFLPFGAFFVLLLPRGRWGAIPAGALVSGVIELGQEHLVSHRSPQRADVLWNTAGAALGVLLASVVLASVRGRRYESDGEHG